MPSLKPLASTVTLRLSTPETGQKGAFRQRSSQCMTADKAKVSGASARPSPKKQSNGRSEQRIITATTQLRSA
jgi:hypothetical protein